jgi:hypothetical protein
MMSIKKRSFFTILVATMFSGAFAFLCCLRSGPVLFHIGAEHADFENEQAQDILNPLRDRSPEKPAESILREIRAGHCLTAVQLSEKAWHDPLCQRDTEYKLLDWSLKARSDDPSGKVVLFYDVKRDFGPKGVRWGDPYWFQVQRDVNGHWAVISLERWF